ncbi:hypothetical protein BTA51_03190 [Hahella sp. CCB-MM4]|uniref:imm11 family protein n=1 Tax=Hahella sp. (strain CCB-MM4) TaxID=1926491 RepID=UPI000B9BEEE2|nr:hypothetical protein [Hahella sp. CCB-MM4]OZG75396.1 hypothetical protein BTA51_03190 [Hahella sp. CCB-MM4]
MTIHRIHHDNNYLVFEIPTTEVINKLGREHPFHIKRAPLPYASVWLEPLTINFRAAGKSSKETIPDIAARNGRLFLNTKAHKALRNILANHGELLPIRFDHQEGYIFNPLRTSEEVSGLNRTMVTYDTNGNLTHLSFIESRVKSFPIFRTELDTYQGIFCTDEFKAAVEKERLQGISFYSDLVNPLGMPFGTSH